MTITYHEEQRTFHLQAQDTSYVIEIVKNGYLANRYYGKRIAEYGGASRHPYRNRAFSPNPDSSDPNFSLDTLPQEYPAYGMSDFRAPAYQAQSESGATVSELLYVSHRIDKGKPKLEGLPATYVEQDVEADTLEIELSDPVLGLGAILRYTVFNNINAISRGVQFINTGKQSIRLLRALSMSIDFPHSDFHMLYLEGAWGRERHVATRRIMPGHQSIESRRGASSHQHHPFVALLEDGANEERGDVYGFSLVYSGNFLAQIEVDQFSTARLSMGINPFDFSWLLEPGETFQTPEVVMVHSADGLGGMSRTYHQLYRSRLMRGAWRDVARPILINNWEATYFDFTAEKIEHIAKAASDVGIELFVLDDGWFGKRNDDTTSLGDWVVDRAKLPNGLSDLAERVNDMGLAFGLWFEPEMISRDSELYRAHPDWCLHVPGYRRSEGRNQLVLDLTREEVCDYIVKAVSDVLASAPIRYVKWDMNRHMTEIGSAGLPPERQRETAHRYILGLYRVLEEITSKFPNILFESCSGGGGRFDPGMLYFMPQTWTSDNTDAVERLKIQFGTSLVYPSIAMGCHVSAVPNHQTGRVTSLAMRTDVAMFGNFGYELDLTKLPQEELDAIRNQVAAYKELRELVQFGDFYRLRSPFSGDDTAWMYVSPDKSEAFIGYYRVLDTSGDRVRRLKLAGLDGHRRYKICETDSAYGGDELMYAGLTLPRFYGDFRSYTCRLRTDLI